ncbi:MAG: type II toxin-antitoxin system mRNA interferase toxin, RelE/StbE family [Bdellovibrionaceae bacterium]|nr:type II toxin-antitoxin system mRNA interferase toxin, RelE/StbE family [Pseudobdellovibrionaceae bacterium]
MWDVFLEKNAVKALGKAPKEIQEKFEKWKDVVQLQGQKGLFEIKGFRDHALKGEWQGARASRLNDQWRVFYYVVADEIKILVMEVTPHGHPKKG